MEQFRALWTNLDAFGPIESVIFCLERLRDFFVLRGCVIFGSERFRDFFVPRGYVFFSFSQEVA